MILSNLKNRLNLANFYLILLLVIFIPFYRFIQALLEYHTSLSPSAIFWLVHWYEPLIVLGVLLALLQLISIKNARLNKSQIVASILIIFGIISSLFISKSFGRGLEGFRFTLFPLVIFFLVSTVPLTDQLKKKIVNAYLTVALIVAFWALIERFFPVNYWGKWGILSPSDLYWYGNHTVSGILQSVSFIGGPNQLASFLLPAVFLFIFKIRDVKPYKAKYLYGLFALTCLFAIILTFSRSALTGLAIGIVVYINFFVKNLQLKRYFLNPLLAAIFIVILFVFYKSNAGVKDIFTHGGSQSGHEVALTSSISEVKSRLSSPAKLLFGSGLGSAGPAIMKYGGDGILSESWYFQLLFELGIFGLALWLFFYIKSSALLLKRNQPGIFLGALSVAVCAIFLHTFADNPAVSYTLFVFLGLYAGNKDE